MATLTQTSGGFYIRFRFPSGRTGKAFKRLIPTDNRQEAEARRKAVELTIHDLQHDRLQLPTDCDDVGTFILSAGKVTAAVKPIQHATLSDLWVRYSEVSTKDSTRTTEKLH